MVVFAWLATLGQWDLGRAERLGDFYDVQARAFLEGRWDVPPESVTIEGIVTDGRTYLYFGPVPALLRLPVLAVGNGLDGRLTAPSLVIALCVALTGVARLSWRIRHLVRGDAGLGRLDLAIAAATTFVAGTGTTMLFLASRLIVYHEAILWGIALSLLAYDAIIGAFEHRRTSTLAMASVLATAAFLTRASVGLGPVVALGVIAASTCIGHLRSRRWTWVAVGSSIAAVALPIVAFVAVNLVKFETPYSLPLDRQVFSRFDDNRRAALRDNGGSLFGLRFVPTTLWQYVRPDAVRPSARFPFLAFPDERATVVGDATFDTIDRAGSAPSSMPVWTVLGVVGAVALARDRRLRLLVPVVGGAVIGATTALTIAFIAHRYLGDAVPILLIVGLVGLHRLGSSRWLLPVAGLALLSLGVNLALGLQYQRLYSTNVEPAARAEFLGWQHRWSIGEPMRESTIVGEILSPPVDGDVFIVDDCDGVYWSDGERWHAVERTVATGRLRVRTTVRVGVVASDANGSGLVLRVVRTAAGQQRFVIDQPNGATILGVAFDPVAGAVELDVAVDRRSAEATVHVDGRLLLDKSFVLLPDTRLSAPPGSEDLATPTPLCDQLTAGISS